MEHCHVITVGIDPGLKGGIVVLGRIAGLIDRQVMPVTGNVLDLKALDMAMREIRKEYNTLHVYLEAVHAMPKQGVSSSFKFGRLFGAVEMALVANLLPYTLVSPARWQRTMHLGIERSLGPKERSLTAAQRLCPGVDLRATERSKVPHSGLVDALLIAAYGLRQ